MNTDELKMINNIDKEASKYPTNIKNIREGVWEKINCETTVIEIDSFRYLAVACAAAAIIALFFSTEILTSIQNTAAWEISEQAINVF